MKNEKDNTSPPKKKKGNPNIGELGKNTRFDKRPDFINKNGRPRPAETIKDFFERFGIDVKTYTKEEMAQEANVILSLSDEQMMFLAENKQQLSQFAKGMLKCLSSVQKTGKVQDLQNTIKIAMPKYFEGEEQYNNDNSNELVIRVLREEQEEQDNLKEPKE